MLTGASSPSARSETRSLVEQLLGPLVGRMLGLGVPAVDVERVVGRVERVPLRNAASLEEAWRREWTALADRYVAFAAAARDRGHATTAGEMHYLACQSLLCAALINYRQTASRRELYFACARAYEESLGGFRFAAVPVRVPWESQRHLPGYLFLPPGAGPFPTVISLSGLGSCKEDRRVFVEPLLARGLAVLVVDLPGTGEALFGHDIKWRLANYRRAFTLVIDALMSRPEVQPDRIGLFGLCLGGALAYRWAVQDPRVRFCVSSFPVFVEAHRVPRWMQESEWYSYSTGLCPTESATFVAEMTIGKDERIACPYLCVQGGHDNWIPLEFVREFFSRIEGDKTLVVVDDEPVFGGGDQVAHTVPVGEQTHWVKHVVADWIVDHAFPSDRPRP